jgi:ATP-binding cassette, subfamily B, bacterial
MRWPDFTSARGFGRSARDSVALYSLAVCAALLLPLLVLILGLVIQLVLGSSYVVMPGDWILHPWTSGRIIPWPWFGKRELCLLTLLCCGVIVGLLEVWALWLLNRAVHRAAMDVVLRFQAEIHRQAYRLGSSDLLGGLRSPPELLVTQTTGMLHRGLVCWWRAVPYAVVAIVALVLMALAVNVWLALVVLLSGVLVRQVFSVVTARAARHNVVLEQAANAAQRQLLESLRLTPLVTGYTLADTPGRPFNELLSLYRTAQLRVDDRRASQGPTLLLLLVLATAYVLLVSGLSPYVTVAGMGVLTTAVIVAYFPAARLSGLPDALATADQAAAELFAYLRRTPAVRNLDSAVPIDRLAESIRFDGVTLANAEGVKLLDALDLTIQARQRVGVLATEPSAAMALAGLMVRLYDPAAGRILFDNYDIATATLETVRGQALVVPADGMLFDGTVQENITCGDAGFTMLQISDAAKQARAQSFILELPRGFATRVGAAGQQLDDGQAFCIGLARALIRNPSVLVLAEPADHLDRAADERLKEALRWAGDNRTLIVIPTRLSTLRSLDKIVVLHEGKVQAAGAHRELLKSCRLYRHLNFVRFHAFRRIR